MSAYQQVLYTVSQYNAGVLAGSLKNAEALFIICAIFSVAISCYFYTSKESSKQKDCLYEVVYHMAYAFQIFAVLLIIFSFVFCSGSECRLEEMVSKPYETGRSCGHKGFGKISIVPLLLDNKLLDATKRASGDGIMAIINALIVAGMEEAARNASAISV